MPDSIEQIRDDIIETRVPDLGYEARLEAEIERLRGIIENPELTDMYLSRGGELRLALMPCIGAKVLAASFADMIDGAPNWRSIEVGPIGTQDEGLILVTVRRASGQSPEVMVGIAKDIIRGLLLVIQDHGQPIDSADLLESARAFAAPVDVNPAARGDSTQRGSENDISY